MTRGIFLAIIFCGLLLSGCGGGGKKEIIVADKIVNPVEKPLGDTVTASAVNQDDANKTDVFAAKFFFKIDKSDEVRFDAIYANCKNESRERVCQIVKLAAKEEKADPVLTEIKKKIREEINTLLGAEFIKEIIATDVNFGTYQN